MLCFSNGITPPDRGRTSLPLSEIRISSIPQCVLVLLPFWLRLSNEIFFPCDLRSARCTQKICHVHHSQELLLTKLGGSRRVSKYVRNCSWLCENGWEVFSLTSTTVRITRLYIRGITIFSLFIHLWCNEAIFYRALHAIRPTIVDFLHFWGFLRNHCDFILHGVSAQTFVF